MKNNIKLLPEYFVGGLIFLFPILSILVKDWVSFTFLILTLGGMTYGLSAWKILSHEEKKLFLGFVLFTLLTSFSFINVDDYRSGLRHFEKYTSFLFAIFPFLFLRKLNIDIAKYLIAGFVMAPIIWLMYYFSYEDGERFSAAYYAIFVGTFSVLIASLSLVYLLMLANNNIKKSISIFVLIVATYVAILSETRGSWIYYPVLIMILIVFYRKNITMNQWIVGLVGFTVFTIIFSLFTPDRVEKRIKNAIDQYQLYQTGENKNTGVGVRLSLWHDSIKLFKQSPLIGVGVGEFEKHTIELKKKDTKNNSLTFGHAHNIFLHLLATTGLLGFVSLVIFVILMPILYFYKIWCYESDKNTKFYALSGVILITSFIVFGLTESWISRNPLVRTYLIMLALLIYSIKSSHNNHTIRNSRNYKK